METVTLNNGVTMPLIGQCVENRNENKETVQNNGK